MSSSALRAPNAETPVAALAAAQLGLVDEEEQREHARELLMLVIGAGLQNQRAVNANFHFALKAANIAIAVIQNNFSVKKRFAIGQGAHVFWRPNGDGNRALGFGLASNHLAFEIKRPSGLGFEALPSRRRGRI